MELVVCGILTLFFLFYFNRLLATLVSYGLRAYTWHKYQVYVDIQALQISLLGGRIFFKGFRYHGENETIHIQNGYITWNYWLRAVKQADCARCANGNEYHSASSDEELRTGSQSSASEPGAKESGAFQAAQDLPSRISVSVSGVEWFIYNRSSAYETIAAAQEPKPREDVAPPNCDSVHKSADSDTTHELFSEGDPLGNQQQKQVLTRPLTNSITGESSIPATPDARSKSNRSVDGHNRESTGSFPPLDAKATRPSDLCSGQNTPAVASPLILTIWPILIECQKGAIVIGNEHTRAILTTSFERSKGHVNAAMSGPRDLYRQIFEFEVTHPVVQMKPNPDYRQSQQSAGQKLIYDASSVQIKQSWWKVNWRFHHQKRRILHNLRTMVPYFRTSVESFRSPSVEEKNNANKGNWPNEVPGESRWLGLSRYLDENERADHESWSNVEYARFSNIIDFSSVRLCLYWDVPGTVSNDTSPVAETRGDDDINLTTPPAYGIDLIVRGGTVNYGPWADRARAEIQNVFFPNPHQDAVPAAPLCVGATRQSTVLNVNVHIENEITMRMPTRESSKDWQWKGRAGALRGASGINQQRDKKHTRKKKDEKHLLGPDVRPFGWFALSVSPNSTVSYNMDLVARKQGYRNDLELDLKGTRMTTSVNHALLWRCGPQKITCDLSNPRGWNASHKWAFDVQSHGMELFLLRDHVFLLTDLIGDFTSGPSFDFLTFVPFLYRINLSFTDIKLYLNANDSNIIDNPCDLDENTFLMLHGGTLDASIDIPLQDYAPSDNRIHFRARARDIQLKLAIPLWNTAHTFASHMPTASLVEFSMDGYYNYWSSTSPRLTDTLFFNLSVISPRIFIYGSLIRYCLKLKDNYFGDDLHFRTLEEYQDTSLKQKKDVKAEPAHLQNKKDNDLDVMLNITFDRVCVLLPANIYSRKENLRLESLLIEADIRFTNYYMDLETRFSPIEAAWESIKAEEFGIDDYVSETQAFVDGIGIHGHRLFGSPPSEPTYVCNWDFDVGHVTGECSTKFVRILLQAIRAFAFTLNDVENALPQTLTPVIYDVTFLRARIGNIKLWVLLEDTAILFGAQQVDIMFNDWAAQSFSERLYFEVPNIQLAAVDQKNAMRHKNGVDLPIPSHATFELSLLLKMVERKRDFVLERGRQQQHVQFHDQRTRRTTWLLHTPPQIVQPREQPRGTNTSPSAMPIPHMPAPLCKVTRTTSRLGTEIESRNGTSTSSLRRKNSFLSNASSCHTPSSRSRKAIPKLAVHESKLSHYQPKSSVLHPMITTNKESARHAAAARSEQHFGVDNEILPNSKPPVTYSSPWTAPYFPLQKITPDTRNLPEKPFNINLAMKNSQCGHDTLSASENFEDDSSLPHSRFDIDLGSAVRGFASPKSFAAFATLLTALQSVHPTDLLDDLQIDTMTEVQKLANAHTELGQTTDFCVRVPFAHLRIVDSIFPCQSSSNDAGMDQYDVQAIDSKVTVRSGTKGQGVCDDFKLRNYMRLHVAIRRSLFEVHDRSLHVFYNKAAATVSFEDVLLWMASDERTIARFQQRNLQLTSSRNQIEYLASLIPRTVDMINLVTDQFSHIDSAVRVQSLVYHLTDMVGAAPDPAFLTRPSYVLRTAGDHLRLSDSWKIASRFRHMLQLLNSHQKATINEQCNNPSASLPPNAEAVFLASFDNWRSWDLAHVRKSLIMRKLWCHAELVENTKPRNMGLLLEIALGKAGFLLDPGPRQNQIGVYKISTVVSTSIGASNDLSNIDGDTLRGRAVLIQSHFSRLGIHLNWELVELIRRTIELFSSNKLVDQSSIKLAKETRHPLSGYQLHIVVGMDSGLITLDTINVTISMAASGFRGSILHRIKADRTETTSALLTSQSASVKLEYDEEAVLNWLLVNSTLYLSRTSLPHRNMDPVVIKVTGRCETLHFEMGGDMGNSLDIATRLIRVELGILKDLASQLGGNVQLPQDKEQSSRHDIYMALLLNDYTLSFAVLPMLSHTVSGKVSRVSVVPCSSSNMAVDFDLKHHHHAVELKNDGMSNQVALLEIPPINGRVIVSRSRDATHINIDTTLDKVELDARSVRSCVDVINKPEIVQALTRVKKSGQQASSQLSTLFSSQSDICAQTPDHSVAFLYDANVTFIGLLVHVSAPAVKPKDYRASLEFTLGLTTVHLHNGGIGEGVVHESPQFGVVFRSISLSIDRQSHRETTRSGNLHFSGQIIGKTACDDTLNQIRVYHATSQRFDVSLCVETACLVVDIAAHLQERIKSLTLADEVKLLKPLRRLTVAGSKEPPVVTHIADGSEENETISSNLFNSIYSLELNALKINWTLDTYMAKPSSPAEDLVFSIQKINLNTKREGSATLAITELQLQLVPKSLETQNRSLNSALMPEVVFKAAYLSTKRDRRLAFQAAGKALDLRLASDFIVPFTAIRTSLADAGAKLREGSAFWAAQPASSKKETTNLFGSKHLASLLIDADFAGAVVNIQPRRTNEERKSVFDLLKGDKRSRAGRWNQVSQNDGTTQATLRAPGVAMKIEYSDNKRDDPALNAEIKVEASSNVLNPSVVPLIIETSSSIKEIVGETSKGAKGPIIRRKSEAQKPIANSSLASSDPANLMGRCKLNLGLSIREQDFSLSCQPIARVAATARFKRIFMAVNTVQSPDQTRFFALSVNFSGLQASVQHVYSRESTASFEVDSIVLSMMNSKHVSNSTGLSAILKVSPIKASVNAKQLQDFLLFREIWYPAELRQASSGPTTASAAADSQAVVVQRYHQVAAAGAFPWNAVVSIQELTIRLDLGQSLGKCVFTISELWASSKKASDFEQNLYLGFDKVGIESTGRMSGSVNLQNFRVRTSIRWPQTDVAMEQAPLVQASLGVDQFRVKAAFDYQPFAIAEISKLDFLMYNVRPNQSGEKDRLVGNLEGEKVQVFCVTASASQALALYQAVIRLTQENEIAYEASLKELDKYLRRKSVFPSSTLTPVSIGLSDERRTVTQAPFSLHTNVVITLSAVNFGAFPTTFFDSQIFKVEATNAQARFTVSAKGGKIHSGLGLTLGQLRVALSNVNRTNTQALGDVSVSDVVNRATSSRGGTILKVPRVIAAMQTWQESTSNHIDYIFKSTFEGKVDVGWNYSRISFIRSMWSTHSQALASRLGKPLPQSAVQITGGLQPDAEGEGQQQEKITAVVNVPQSRFEYRALQPPVIETPQLRDMGEATPPLEWIGLQRDKLPNVTHQIIIVSLLEVAKEVEDAYSRILGSSH